MTDEDVFERVARQVDPQCTLVRAWGLTGGVSAQVTALEVALAGGASRTMVVRCPEAPAADAAREEFTLLRILHAKGLPVPAPYYLDSSGEILPTPYLVMEFVEGTTEPTGVVDVVGAMATCLAAVHRTEISNVDLSFLPDPEQTYEERLRTRPAIVDDSLDEGRIRAVLAPAWPPRAGRHNAPVVLHGDFWPGNVLWRDGRIAGVVDWEDAALGDPLADLGNSRLEVAWAFGLEAMAEFTRHYAGVMPAVDLAHLPYWDLCAALRPASRLADWGLEREVELAMRRVHRLFVDAALAQLG